MQPLPSVRALRFVAAGLLALAILGCGESFGTVSGDVKLKGKPLPSGIITFASQSGRKRVISGPIKDGKYSVAGVPASKTLISIQNTTVVSLIPPKEKDPKDKDKDKGKGKGKGKDKDKDDGKVPAKYSDPTKSGLELDVTAGEQTHDISID
jgi:hypothetical protein